MRTNKNWLLTNKLTENKVFLSKLFSGFLTKKMTVQNKTFSIFGCVKYGQSCTFL